MATRTMSDKPHAKLSEQVLELMPAWSLEQLDAFEYLSGGYSNHNYLFRYRHNNGAQQQYVLRVPFMTQLYVDRVYEKRYHQQLHATGLQSWKILALNENTGVMISPWLEGKLLADTKPTPSPTVLSRYLANLHEKLPNPGRAYPVIELAQAWLGQVPRKIVTELKRWPEERKPAHNDLNPWNILLEGPVWHTLDWEFAGYNDPWFDVVALCYGLELSQSQLLEFASLYLADRQWTEPSLLQLQDTLHLAAIAFELREWSWASYQLQQGNVREEIEWQAESYKTRLSERLGSLT